MVVAVVVVLQGNARAGDEKGRSGMGLFFEIVIEGDDSLSLGLKGLLEVAEEGLKGLLDRGES